MNLGRVYRKLNKNCISKKKLKKSVDFLGELYYNIFIQVINKCIIRVEQVYKTCVDVYMFYTSVLQILSFCYVVTNNT